MNAIRKSIVVMSFVALGAIAPPARASHIPPPPPMCGQPCTVPSQPRAATLFETFFDRMWRLWKLLHFGPRH